MSQNKNYTDFLNMMAALVGIPPNRITTEIEANWRVLFNNAIADIWERGPFLEISPFGEARFVDNHLDYANNLKASAWVPTGLEVTKNAVANPLDWRINATELLETAEEAEHKVVQTVTKWIPGVKYQASFYARYKGRPLISLEIWDGVEEYYGTFNILTGVVAGYSSSAEASIQQIANNFYYCKIKFTTNAEASVTGTYTIRLSGEDTNQFILTTADDDNLITSEGDTLVTDCESRCLYWNTEQTCEVDVCTPAPENILAPVLSINVDQGADTMELTWVNGEDDYDNLYLERSTDGVTFSPLITLAGNATSYDDTDVLLGQIYYYRIRGIVAGSYSAYSNTVNGTLTIGAPVLSITVDDDNDQLDLEWTNGEPDYTNLYLERSVGDDDNFVPLATLPGNDTSYVDSDVELEVEYFYRIRGEV